MLGGPLEISEHVYRSDPGVNISSLKHFETTPAKARRRMDIPSKPSPAQKLGTAIHAAILEPEKFLATYAIRPEVDARTKAGKAALAEVSGELLPRDEYEGCLEIAAKIREHDFYRRFVEGGVYESSWFAEHDLGLRIKGRLDVWLPEKNVIVDIKTTDSALDRSFSKDAIKYGYHCQAAWYMDLVARVTGTPVSGYVILAVEKTEDRDVRAFWLDDELIDYGRKLYRHWLSQYHICHATGEWPGYPAQIETLKMPSYLREGF